MSVQALGWVLDHSPTKGSDRLVLISIANHAGQQPVSDDGRQAWEAWPGVATMQREAGLDRARTVNDALARLVKAGALERIVNGAPDERIRRDRRPNLYRLLLASGVTCGDTRCRWCGMTPDAPRGDDLRRDGVTFRDATGCRETSPEPSGEPPVEPSVEPPMLELVAPAGPAVTFDAFWAVYPRRLARASAEQAWARAVKAAAPTTIIEGAKRYADEVADRDQSKIAHAATWLNGRRWEDPPGANASGRPRRGATAPVSADRTAPAGRVKM